MIPQSEAFCLWTVASCRNVDVSSPTSNVGGLIGPTLTAYVRIFSVTKWPDKCEYTIHSYVNVRKRFSYLHGHIGLKKPWIYFNLLIHPPPLAFNNHSFSTYRWLYYLSWPSYVKNKDKLMFYKIVYLFS